MNMDLRTLLSGGGSHLLPAERGTVHFGGKSYMWGRDRENGPIALYPGYAPGDPAGCQATQAPILHVAGAPSWPRTCTLHRGHGTRHLHRGQLGDAPDWWGEPPRRMFMTPTHELLDPGQVPGTTAGLTPVIVVEALEGVNVTTGQEPDRTREHR